MTGNGVALSVKQPWAALIAAGVKTVEVRTWSTSRRGTVFIHAAKVPDDRPHGWTFANTPQLERDAAVVGGVIAVAELVDCICYDDAVAFAADAARHRNAAGWFRPPRLFGLVFADVRPVPFHRTPGNTFFFPVSGVTVPGNEGHPQGVPLPIDPVGAPLVGALPSPPPPQSAIIIDPPEGKDFRTP